MSFSLVVSTPERMVFAGSVTRVTLPGSRGAFEVLRDHAPLVDKLAEGALTYHVEGAGVQSLEIGEGLVEVFNNEVCVLLPQVPFG